MRENLKDKYNQRIKVEAIVDRYGEKTGYKGRRKRTVCFIDVKDPETDNFLTDHIWFTVGKRIEKCELIPGDNVTFEARVSDYMKGYHKDEYDYKLSYPTKFKVIKKAKIPWEEIKEEIKRQKERRKEMKELAKKAEFSYKNIESKSNRRLISESNPDDDYSVETLDKWMGEGN
jgi:hypothetical protein